MDESGALTQFASGDDKAARQAFDCLTRAARPYLAAVLSRTTGLRPEQREDVIQSALTQAWAARGRYKDAGIDAWRGYLKTTVRHCCIDLYRRRTEDASDSAVLEETIAGEYSDTISALMDAIEAETIHRQADILWLGLDPTLPPEAHTRRLLAAQLSYLDNMPWKTVCHLVGPPCPGEPPLTRERLDTWLSDISVLRHLAFHTLYYANDRLAGSVLGLNDPPSCAELDTLGQAAAHCPAGTSGPSSWAWPEVSVILWRYRYALLFEHILQRADCALSPDALTALLDRTRSCFPFSEAAAALTAALGSSSNKALSDRGLWQRLAFQYRYVDDLPHNDIRERTQPAYRLVAKPEMPAITDGMLNVWLSNGRLLERLARACRGLESREGHE